jgi:hypothetical protein
LARSAIVRRAISRKIEAAISRASNSIVGQGAVGADNTYRARFLYKPVLGKCPQKQRIAEAIGFYPAGYSRPSPDSD